MDFELFSFSGCISSYIVFRIAMFVSLSGLNDTKFILNVFLTTNFVCYFVAENDNKYI